MPVALSHDVDVLLTHGAVRNNRVAQTGTAWLLAPPLRHGRRSTRKHLRGLDRPACVLLPCHLSPAVRPQMLPWRRAAW